MGDAPQTQVMESPYRFTVEDFHRMSDAGIFDEDDRVELINGVIYSMSPIGSRHNRAVMVLTRHFATDRRVLLQPQGPLQIPPRSEPQPDLLLLKPRPDEYADQLPQPADVLLAIEVADSSVDHDRRVKAPLYGQHGVPELWIVDVLSRMVSIYRQPDAKSPDGYMSTQQVTEGALAPACLPDVPITLDSLFGPVPAPSPSRSGPSSLSD